MPIYEYECMQCGSVEEAFQSITDKPITSCSQCSGKLQKLISQSTFHLKGSGWYVTDYADKSGGRTPKKTGSESSSPAKSEPASKKQKKKDTGT